MTGSAVRIGCAVGTPGAAVEKALNEAAVLHRWPVRPLEDPQRVRGPRDHAALWSSIGAADEARWIVDGDLEDMPTEPEPTSWVELTDCPDPNAVFVQLQSPTPDHVVMRSLSTSLMPLTFGYDREPRDHLRARDFTWPEGPAKPHPFA
jgi:hypothetical protein